MEGSTSILASLLLTAPPAFSLHLVNLNKCNGKTLEMAGNLEINFILSPEVIFKILSNEHRSIKVDRCYRAGTG